MGKWTFCSLHVARSLFPLKVSTCCKPSDTPTGNQQMVADTSIRLKDVLRNGESKIGENLVKISVKTAVAMKQRYYLTLSSKFVAQSAFTSNSYDVCCVVSNMGYAQSESQSHRRNNSFRGRYLLPTWSAHDAASTNVGYDMVLVPF